MPSILMWEVPCSIPIPLSSLLSPLSAEATVPKVTVITRKAYGGAYDGEDFQGAFKGHGRHEGHHARGVRRGFRV